MLRGTFVRRVTELDTISIDEVRALAASRFGDMINLYPDVAGEDWLEFDSMINLRPSFGNRSRGVEDPATRATIAGFIDRVVRR